MPSGATENQLREWFLAAVVVVTVGGDIASRYWGTASESHVTAGQVTTLTDQVHTLSSALKDLSDKISTMPATKEVDALVRRADRDEAAINAAASIIAGLRADVDNLMRPTPFRRPQ